MCQGMSACADRKAYGDVLRLLDLNLAATRRKMERQSTGAARRRAAPVRDYAVGRRASVRRRIWIGTTYRTFSIDFPQANEYLDTDAIQVLRHGVRALQARRSPERPGRPFPPPGRRGHRPRRGDLSPAGAELDPLVERRQGRGDRRADQGRRGLAARVRPPARPGRADGAAGRSRRGPGDGRRRPAARQPRA